ncbi:hypothetical protein [Amycolatopsis sacchari]|uniref:hypothetical protein n=1 Tax=Amycolatopsis sacchari TaxID=115433 RepID=UPI003D754CF0
MTDLMFTLPLTDVGDGLAHEVTDEAFAAGQGQYRAVCGAVVCPAAATVPLGPECPDCARVQGRWNVPFYVEVPAQRRGRPRHRRPSRLQQLLLGARSAR